MDRGHRHDVYGDPHLCGGHPPLLFHQNWVWSEILVRYLIVWCTFLGGAAAYFVRTLAIVFVIVILMSFILMFCEAGFALGGAFFGFWITKVPGIFVVAYITALIAIAPSMKATGAICSKEG